MLWNVEIVLFSILHSMYAHDGGEEVSKVV